MTYINWKPDGDSHRLETVDQFETRSEAQAMLREYQEAFCDMANLYLSQRCTADWEASK